MLNEVAEAEVPSEDGEAMGATRSLAMRVETVMRDRLCSNIAVNGAYSQQRLRCVRRRANHV